MAGYEGRIRGRVIRSCLASWAKSAGATKALKAADQMKCIGIMITCKAQAEEAIFQKIIFA